MAPEKRETYIWIPVIGITRLDVIGNDICVARTGTLRLHEMSMCTRSVRWALDQGRFHVEQHELDFGRLTRKPELFMLMQWQQYLSSIGIWSDSPSTTIGIPDSRILAHELLS